MNVTKAMMRKLLEYQEEGFFYVYGGDIMDDFCRKEFGKTLKEMLSDDDIYRLTIGYGANAEGEVCKDWFFKATSLRDAIEIAKQHGLEDWLEKYEEEAEYEEKEDKVYWITPYSVYDFAFVNKVILEDW